MRARLDHLGSGGGAGVRMSRRGRRARTPTRLLALVAGLALAPGVVPGRGAAAAQEPGPAPEGLEELQGERVRVTLPIVPARVVLGRLEGGTGEALLLRRSSRAPLDTIPLSTVGRLEVSSGLRSHTGQGAAVGALVGGAVGLVIAAAAEKSCFSCSGNVELAASAFLGLLAAGVGSGVGALIGSTARSERWVEVPVPGLDVGLVPVGPGSRPAAGARVRVRTRR